MSHLATTYTSYLSLFLTLVHLQFIHYITRIRLHCWNVIRQISVFGLGSAIPKVRHSEGPPFRGAAIPKGRHSETAPFQATNTYIL